MYIDILLRVIIVCNERLKKLWIFLVIILNFDECLKIGIVKCECNFTGGYCGEDLIMCRKKNVIEGVELI